MQNMTLTLSELVYQPMATSLLREDFAILLEERIAEASELQAKCDELQDRVDELAGIEEERDEAIAALRALVDAIENAQGAGTRPVRVGSLTISGPVKLAVDFGDALEVARALL